MASWKRTMRRGTLIIAAILLIFGATATTRAENWPQFRGPTGQGISAETNLPIHWSGAENIAWKTPVPGIGWSSPVVWDARIFVTATSEDGTACRVICLDRDSGKVLWNTHVFSQIPTRKEQRNSYATPTALVDGRRVLVAFGEGGMASLDLDGNIIWVNTDNHYYSQHGLGASPIAYDDLLYLPFDWSSPTGELRQGWQLPWEKSYVLALDINTGKERFKAMRGASRIGHSTPRIVEVDGTPQLVSAAGDIIEGFDPKTGSRIWWVYCGGESVVPSPVFGDGIVYNTSGFPTPVGKQTIYPAIRAFRLGGKGDMTRESLLWEQKKNVPMIPSLLLARQYLYSIKENGMLQCLDPKTGDAIWSHRMDGNYSASPVFADGRIYLLSDSATTTIIEPGRGYKEIAVNELEGQVQASVAVSNGHLFIRTQDAVYCIGSKSN